MERCTRCGATDPLRMYGLMSHWFASPAGLALEGGYFYLCPRCFDETIAPGLDEILDKLREHLPAPPTAPHAGFMHAPGDGQAPAPRVQRPGPPAEGKAPDTLADSAARDVAGTDSAASTTTAPPTGGAPPPAAGPTHEPGDAAGSPPA